MHYILALILLTASLYAKSTDFSIIIDEPFNNSLQDVTEDYDRTISAVGFVKTYKKSSNINQNGYTNAFDYLASLSNRYGSQIHLVKIDNNANILLRKSTDLSNFNEAVAVVKTPQNGYFIGGHTLDGSLIILKLDLNGNIIFTKTFGTSNLDKMSNLILLRDGGVLAIGSSVTSRSQHDNIFETGLGLNDIYISRFSKDGTKLWSKKYGTEHDDRGVDAVEASDGSIIVLSQTNYDKFKNFTLMRISENGDKLWLKHYKNEKVVIAHRVIQLKENNFVASLTQENDMRKEQIRLLKFDIQKNILLDKTISTTYASALYDIKEYSDSRLIGVGYVNDKYNTDALAMLLDSDFTMLNQEHYGKDEYDVFNAVTILHNSQAAAVGVYTNRDSQETNMWIVKLNRDISMAQIAKKAEKPAKKINFYEELSALFKEEIAANKIVIENDLYINFIHKSLYFEVSKYELTDEQKEFLQKFGVKLLPFLNRHKEYIATLEINGHTSSEWGVSDFKNRYLKNSKLSMNRSYSTLSYMFNNQNRDNQELLSDIIKGSGLSFSKKVISNEKEDKEKSRRVSFKIVPTD